MKHLLEKLRGFHKSFIKEKIMTHLINKWLLMLILAVPIIMSGCSSKGGDVIRVGPDKTWVVIMELEEYPDGYTDLITDFESARRMESMFLKMGVESDHMRIVLDQMDRSDVLDSLEWLDGNADKDDVVFFYVAAHGQWLAREVMWEAFISEEWLDLDIRNKVLMIDSCLSGKFIKGYDENPEAGMAIASVASNELGWAGLEEEGLPIIGSVWTHYFTESVLDEKADLNGDKLITMEEALNYADPQVTAYMRDEVFAVEEFLKMYHDAGIYPLEVETYPNPVFHNNFEKDLVLYDMSKE